MSNPGRRIHKVALQTIGTSKGPFGNDAEAAPVTVRQPFAFAKKMHGDERYIANQIMEGSEWKFELAWIDGKDVKTTWRLVYNGETHDILDVDNVREENHTIILTTKIRRAN